MLGRLEERPQAAAGKKWAEEEAATGGVGHGRGEGGRVIRWRRVRVYRRYDSGMGGWLDNVAMRLGKSLLAWRKTRRGFGCVS